MVAPRRNNPSPQKLKSYKKLVPLWKHSIHAWTQILGRGPDGRPYFLDDKELQWANPTLRTPPPQSFPPALAYMRALWASTDPTHWEKLNEALRPPHSGTSPSHQDGGVS